MCDGPGRPSFCAMRMQRSATLLVPGRRCRGRAGPRFRRWSGWSAPERREGGLVPGPGNLRTCSMLRERGPTTSAVESTLGASGRASLQRPPRLAVAHIPGGKGARWPCGQRAPRSRCAGMYERIGADPPRLELRPFAETGRPARLRAGFGPGEGGVDTFEKAFLAAIISYGDDGLVRALVSEARPRPCGSRESPP